MYSPNIQIELEKKFKFFENNNINNNKNSIVRVSINEINTSYLIDFVKMKQKNEKTGFTRDIQRVASDLTNNEGNNDSLGPSSNLRKRNLTKSASGVLLQSENNKRSKTQSNKEKENNIDNSNEKEEIEMNEENCEPNSSKTLRKSRATKSYSVIKTEIKKEIDENEERTEKPTRSSAKLAKRKIKDEAENDDEIVEENKPMTSKSAAKKSKSSKSIKEEPQEDDNLVLEEEKEEIKTIKFTGDIPLDETFAETIGFDYKIYREENDIYDVMLNQTNLQNNNNKYYLIQLVEHVKTKNYIVWMRWGRVGKKGQNSAERCGSNLLQAKNIFCKKFQDKTYNSWEERHDFVKHGGKYDLVHKDYDDFKTEEEKLSIKQESNDSTDSKASSSLLEKPVQEFIELICNVSEMEELLKEMKYDAKKSPLGKLSKNQIKAGYASLKKIEELIRNNQTGRDLIEANNEFYTRIPHDFGMRKPPIISTLPHLREKLRLIEVLDDVEVAVKALNQKSEIANPIDRHYDQLECKLKVIDHNDKIFKIIEDYLKKTHAPTHNNYKLSLVDVFETEKEQETFNDCGNRMLLWHGSRLTNWAGILSAGLKIAPPEAPVTGYMFGKGCYFADCSSKSANYCYTSSSKNIGILSLCEVSLGNCNELKQADYNADKLPQNKQSTKGLGKSEPDRKEWITLDNGCVIPVGKIKQVVDKNDAINYSLLYNEYVVYNTNQIKMRYLVKVKFDYDNIDSDDE